MPTMRITIESISKIILKPDVQIINMYFSINFECLIEDVVFKWLIYWSIFIIVLVLFLFFIIFLLCPLCHIEYFLWLLKQKEPKITLLYVFFSPSKMKNQYLWNHNKNQTKLHANMKTYNRYKKTVVFDPSKSETYRAIQDEQYGAPAPRVHEIPITVQHQTYHPTVGTKVSKIYQKPNC